ncbi:MAG TPA: hypothetical protein VFL93_10800 [Longimicrobiaceae bacterium]|nr:hypothetical protein [Longimicrobiaceae bacterium]
MKRIVELDVTLDPTAIADLLRTSTWQEASQQMEAAVREAEELIAGRLQALMERAVAEPAAESGLRV